jgi:hypothetical protein
MSFTGAETAPAPTKNEAGLPRPEPHWARLVFVALSSDTTTSLVFGALALQVRQHAHATVDVLRRYRNDFLADAMKFQIDAHVAYGQVADAQRLDAVG